MADSEARVSEGAALLSPFVIVGGKGRMGQWMARLLTGAGVHVSTIDRDTSDEERLFTIRSASTVLFALPIDKSVDGIRLCLPDVPATALVCDITSTKSGMVDEMKRHPGEVVGLHPMCGPISTGLRGQVVVWCMARQGIKTDVLFTILTSLGAQLVEMAPEEHDRLMSVVQAANHFQSIVSAHLMGALGIDVMDALQVASPIYRMRMQLMGRVLAQDPGIYVDMMLDNPHAESALRSLLASSSEFLEKISAKDRAGCIDFFEQARKAVDGYREQALEESEQLLTAWVRQQGRREKDCV